MGVPMRRRDQNKIETARMRNGRRKDFISFHFDARHDMWAMPRKQTRKHVRGNKEKQPIDLETCR